MDTEHKTLLLLSLLCTLFLLSLFSTDLNSLIRPGFPTHHRISDDSSPFPAPHHHHFHHHNHHFHHHHHDHESSHSHGWANHMTADPPREECGSQKDPASCDGLAQCTWCKSAAIPSRCYDKELAKKLPAGVFTCDHSRARLDLTLDSVNVPRGGRVGAARKLCDPNVGQAAGYFRLGQQDKHYFFWFFESRSDPARDPIILWMTGGPGCASEIALFAENGPCHVTKDGEETVLNPYSWTNNASVIFIDQPAGTGFSWGEHDRNEEQVGSDMNIFIRAFYAQFPKFSTSKLFVFGESYAGHYVPATAHAVWRANQDMTASAIPLGGVGIGNGLTDPEIQYAFYSEMAYHSGTAPARVSETSYKLMQAATPACIKAIQKCNAPRSGDWMCVAAMNFCNAALMAPYAASGYNQYDMRIKCEVPGLCYDFSPIQRFLSKREVLDYLQVDERKRHWQSCDSGVHADLMGDWMKNYAGLLPDLLEDGIPVLVYAGDVDFIVNYLGCRAWPLALEWSGRKGYNAAEEAEWKVGKSSAAKGLVRNHGPLTFLQVYQAGHMVPMDQPEAALEMVNQFIQRGQLKV